MSALPAQPSPVQDPARLAALAGYAILDTPPERGFDDIAALAGRLCAVPTALVSLVDVDRQWFKARVGFAPCQTGLDRAICVNALDTEDLLVIPDLARDPRTAANPLVTAEPGLRFYAGAPLRTPAGEALGTLCVMDTAPRPGGLDPAQASSLRALARQVMDQLELRRALRARDAALAALDEGRRKLDLERAMLQAVFRQAPVGICITDAASAWTTMVNDRAEAVLGHGLGDPVVPGAGPLHADGTPYAPSEYATSRALDRGETVSSEIQSYRNARDGSVRRVAVSSAPVRDGEGTILAAVTVIADVEEKIRAAEALRASEERYRRLVDLSPGIIWYADAEGRPTYLSGRYYDVTGETRPVEGARPKVAAIHPEDAARTAAAWHAARAAGEPFVGEARLRDREGGYRWYAVRGEPMRDESGTVRGWLGHAGDISERKLMEERQELLHGEMAHRMKNLLAMAQAIVTQTMRGATDVKSAGETLAARLVALGKAHDILLRGMSGSAGLETLVREGLEISRSINGQLALSGPPVEIGPKAGLALVLTIHELATNAIKYGALSVPDGRVSVAWEILGPEGDETLRLAWTETGGPAVAPPARRGFGTRLIERGLTGHVGGTLRMAYPPEGVTCLVEAPLSGFTAAL